MARYEGSFAGRRISKVVGPKGAWGYSRPLRKGSPNKNLKGMQTEPEDVMENLGIDRMD